MYALIENGSVAVYPYGARQLRKDNPNTSFSTQMSDIEFEEWGVFRVVPSALPTYDEITHIVEEAPPVLVNGVWEQQWNIVALSAEQAAQNQAEKDDADSIDLARTQAKADGFVQQFVAMTPAQVSTYVADNVNTLADAKNLLAKLALMMLAIAKEQYK